jgi:hypothetical protein
MCEVEGGRGGCAVAVLWCRSTSPGTSCLISRGHVPRGRVPRGRVPRGRVPLGVHLTGNAPHGLHLVCELVGVHLAGRVPRPCIS